MYIDDRSMLGIARQVVGHIDEGGDRPFAVFAGVMNKVRLNHVLGAHAAHQRRRKLPRYVRVRQLVAEGIDPQVAGSGGASVGEETARTVRGERRRVARNLVHSLGQTEITSLSGGDIVEINLDVAIDVRGVGQ